MIYAQFCNALGEGVCERILSLSHWDLKGCDLLGPFLCLGDRCHKQIKDICLNSFNGFVCFMTTQPALRSLFPMFVCFLACFLPSFFFLVYLLWVVAIPWVTGWLTNMTMGHFRTYCLKRSWMLYIPSGSWNLTAALLPSLVPHLKWYRILCFNRFDTFFFNMVGSTCRNVILISSNVQKITSPSPNPHPLTPNSCLSLSGSIFKGGLVMMWG